MKCSCCNIILLAIGILGVILVILGPIIGFVIAPPIVEEQITEQVQLLEDTEQFERWVKTPMPLTFKIYVFHVENPDEILTGAKPKVKEVGPYVYKQFREKDKVEYNEADDTLEYMQNLKFEFDAEASSPLTENDEVTVLNVALQGVWQIAEEGGSLQLSAVSMGWSIMFHGETSPFHTIKVKDLFFDGYRFCDPSKITGIALVACNTARAHAKNSATLVVEDDNTIVFSFFKHKEREADGPYVIKAGNVDVNEVGAIETWKGLDFITTWVGGNETKCNDIRGRDSTIYPPFNNDTSSFDVFNTDICRIVNLRTKYESSYEDIDGYVAELGIDALSNSADEACYCTKSTKNLKGENDCFPDGFGDMGTCLSAPVVISFPHFLGIEDKDYTETVEGLTPDEEKHRTFVMIEPGTGSPLKGAKRMQFNMVIRKIDQIAITNELQPAMMPILWVEEGVELPTELVEKLKNDYLNKLVALDAVTYTLLGVGVVLLLVGFGALLCRRNK